MAKVKTCPLKLHTIQRSQALAINQTSAQPALAPLLWTFMSDFLHQCIVCRLIACDCRCCKGHM